MKRLSREQKEHFQRMIFSWWKTHRRDLPWRHTRDPYTILISEIMLQQTQVSRVIPKFIEFLNTFPTIKALAEAKTAHVLRMWKGMGYNRRALYIHQAAKQILQDYNGKFPERESELIQLPGLGKYTARALLVFSFNKNIALVDTNIRKIFIHFFFQDKPQSDKIIYKLAEKLFPKGRSWVWHQALMDYGAQEFRNKQIYKSANKQIKHIPFQQSNRYFRGRIVDFVRQNTWKERDLIAAAVKQYGKDRKFMGTIINGLLKEGLISRSKAGIISLPE